MKIGGVYDVSGVIGFTVNNKHNMFAYYGPYEDAFDPSNESVEYLLEMPDARKAYYNFYIDPETFENRLGYWYQYSGEYERSANKRAFYVSDRCIVSADNAVFVDVNSTPVLLNPYVIEARHESDILLSNDDPLILENTTGIMRVWLFGTTSNVLSHDINLSEDSHVVFDTSITQNLVPGEYTLVLERPGADGRYDIDYETNNRNPSSQKLLVPRFRNIDVVDVTAYPPGMLKDALLSLAHSNRDIDDVFVEIPMVVQDPYVDISGYQEIVIGNTSHVLEVTGYTNKIPGSMINLHVDLDDTVGKSINYPSMTITTEYGNIGDYRTFHGYIPLYYSDLATGAHTLTAVLDSGAFASVTFHVGELPEEPHKEPKYYKFIDGNPFIPEPTPIIIEKEVVREVVKTEYKTVIEKEPVDYETLAWVVINTLVVPVVTGIVFIVLPVLYLMSVVVRVFAERRTRKKNNESENNND